MALGHIGHMDGQDPGQVSIPMIPDMLRLPSLFFIFLFENPV